MRSLAWALPELMHTPVPLTLSQPDAYEYFSDGTEMALFGLVLGWLVRITDPARARWLFSR